MKISKCERTTKTKKQQKLDIRIIVLFASLCSVIAYVPSSHSKAIQKPEISNPEENTTVYQIKSMDARSAYKLLATREGKTIDISPRVQGTIENVTLSGTITEKLNLLAKLSNSDWFLSGDHLFVSSATERLSRIIALKGMTGSAAEMMIESAGMKTTMFPLRSSPDGQFITVSAPAKYIAIIETIIQSQMEDQNELTLSSVRRKGTNKIRIIRYGSTSYVNSNSK